MGKTVFATDAVGRPDACQLFSAYDPQSLSDLFQQYQPEASLPNIEDGLSGIEAILKVYQKAHADFPAKR